jgi:hypothetical protein
LFHCLTLKFVHIKMDNSSSDLCLTVCNSQSNSMEQDPSWESDSHSVNQEISPVLWNPKVHYHVHKNPPVDSILSQMNLVYILTPYFFKINFNIILPSMSRFPKQSLLFMFSDYNLACIFHPPHVS